MGKKNELPVDMATALDCAIRDFEVAGDQTKFGYQIDGNDYPYNNYLSNTYWVSFLEEMSKHHRQQFDDGAGGELNEKKGRWGIYPPKMASYGSSSRLIYKLSKGTEGFIFEERLDTRVGGIANLDGLLHKGNKYIYVEAKRREIYGASHEKQEVKCVYFPVYNKISEICGSSRFRYEPKSEIIVSESP